jgi:uncharacterized metal-binding protein YceD (DUF177 family)
MSADGPVNEFSRPVLADPARERIHIRIEATVAERAALAARFALPALDSLTAEGELRARPGERWAFRARIRASLAQTCVVTLEPTPRTVDEHVEILFAPAGREDPQDLDVGEEEAEPLPADGRIDAGEIVAQSLYLALDPFPRSDAAAWSDRIEDRPAPPAEGAEAGRQSPFATLAGRLRGEGSGEA